jgi:broad specificity phosphatase PhoE
MQTGESPAGALTIVAVRHGRTAWNAERRFQGHADVPLDAAGLAQAAALHTRLRGERFDAAVSSDLSRALTTAHCITAGSPAVEPDARWREMMFGEWEGLTWPEIAARFPGVPGAPNAGGEFVTPPGGESFAAVRVRVAAALDALRARFPAGATVLVATHAGALHALLHETLGVERAKALAVRFEPATITRLRLAPDGNDVLELNVSPAMPG